MGQLLRMTVLFLLPLSVALGVALNRAGSSLWGGSAKTYAGPPLTVSLQPPPGAVTAPDGTTRVERSSSGSFAVQVDGRPFAQAPELVRLSLVRFRSRGVVVSEGFDGALPVSRLGLGYHHLRVELESGNRILADARLQVEVVRTLTGQPAPAPRIVTHTPPLRREGSTLIFGATQAVRVTGAVDEGAALSWWVRPLTYSAPPRRIGAGASVTLDEALRRRELILRSELPGRPYRETRLVYEREAPTSAPTSGGTSAGLTGALSNP